MSSFFNACCGCDPFGPEGDNTQLTLDDANPGQPSASSSDNGDSDGVLTLTPEQKQREKERLQALVKTFAKAAVSGVHCWFLDILSEQRVPATYSMDKALRTFCVAFENGVQHAFSMRHVRPAVPQPQRRLGLSRATNRPRQQQQLRPQR
eukprot:GHVT01100480.1.p1 GENE.GHVT01100480.1~~GHVT01100480.1.p1  ORF type:complete len:150 (-),score=28.27 GHVT01100480.1:217-666(-)